MEAHSRANRMGFSTLERACCTAVHVPARERPPFFESRGSPRAGRRPRQATRRTGRSESYPRSSLGVPRQVLTHGAVNLTFRGGEIFGTHPLPTTAQDSRDAHADCRCTLTQTRILRSVHCLALGKQITFCFTGVARGAGTWRTVVSIESTERSVRLVAFAEDEMRALPWC